MNTPRRFLFIVCAAFSQGCGYVTVYVQTVPPGDPGRFNVQIDGTQQLTDAADGSVLHQLKLRTGDHVLAETAGTATDLGDFAVTIGNDCEPNGKFILSHGDDKSCTITNTRTKFAPQILGHPCVKPILAGQPYDIDDPQWVNGDGNMNKDVCAYLFYAAFHVLGYNTDGGGTLQAADKPQVAVLNQFQNRYGLPVNTLVTTDVVNKLETLLEARQAQIAAVAKAFPLYDHVLPLHPNDVTKDWLAYFYQLPMTALPQALQMGAYETAECIWGQCVGFVRDANDKNLPCQQQGCYTADLSGPYYFVGAYFDPNKGQWAARLPSAAVFVGTVVHEYSHYLDGTLHSAYQGLPHLGSVATHDFYDIQYDMSQRQSTCAPRRSNDVHDWITNYAYQDQGGCPQGFATFAEDWAESMSMYVQDGKAFRAAAQKSVILAKSYAWLKANVFNGVEYDTSLQREVDSGCNDVPGYAQAQPGYASCSLTYVWDGTLPIK